jgi:hypothetical protein
MVGLRGREAGPLPAKASPRVKEAAMTLRGLVPPAASAILAVLIGRPCADVAT